MKLSKKHQDPFAQAWSWAEIVIMAIIGVIVFFAGVICVFAILQAMRP